MEELEKCIQSYYQIDTVTIDSSASNSEFTIEKYRNNKEHGNKSKLIESNTDKENQSLEISSKEITAVLKREE